MSKARLAAALSAGVLALTVPVVQHFEGLENDPYRDIAGILSVCYGDTYGIQMRRYSDEECTQRLLQRLAEHDADLMRCVTRPMPDHVHAAVLSWTYNIGASKACGSTLVRKLNAGDIPGACAELSRFVCVKRKADPKRPQSPQDAARCPVSQADRAAGFESAPVPGLVRRRDAERKLCEGKS